MRPRAMPLAFVELFLFCSASLAPAGVEYTVTDLGNFQGTAANNRGQVVGYAQAFPPGLGPNNDSYLSDNGRLIDLTKTVGLPGMPQGIGNGGQIVGTYPITGDPSGIFHAFLFSGGKLTDLGSLGGSSTAGRINDQGQVIGDADVVSLQGQLVSHAVLYSGGNVIDLGTFGGFRSFAADINDSGEIVGSAATKMSVSLRERPADGLGPAEPRRIRSWNQ